MKYFFASILLFFASSLLIGQNNKALEILIKPELHRICKKPVHRYILDKQISEGSGLVAWNGKLWTHNDSGEPVIYSLDTIGNILGLYPLPGFKNDDWEDMSSDENYFYVGAFGNNVAAKDTLQILKIDKKSLLNHKPIIERISFSWPETTTGGKTSKVNFDCEAMFVRNDSIFLFTKEWKKGRRTRLFSLPTFAGNYEVKYLKTIRTKILITGANYNREKKSFVLCGYNFLGRSFLLVFENTLNNDFRRATRIKIRKRRLQTEGVASFDGNTYFTISENLKSWFLNNAQSLQQIQFRE